MAVDFHQEIKWKRAAAKHLALSCQAAYRLKRNAKIDAENWSKRRCAQVAKMIRDFWANLKALNSYEAVTAQKLSKQNGLLMRPETPDSVDEREESSNLPKEVQLLVDDQKKPLHMICDVHGHSQTDTRKMSLADRARLIQEKVTDNALSHSLNLQLFPYQRKTINWLLASRIVLRTI